MLPFTTAYGSSDIYPQPQITAENLVEAARQIINFST